MWRFAVDSDGELDKLAECAPGAAVLLRLDAGAGGTVGDQGKFGVPPEQVAGLARLAASLRLRPYGLAFHVGSQKMDPAAWDGPIRQCAAIMTELAADGIRLEMLDLGGGYSGRSAFNGYPAPGVRIVSGGTTPRPVRAPEKALA